MMVAALVSGVTISLGVAAPAAARPTLYPRAFETADQLSAT